MKILNGFIVTLLLVAGYTQVHAEDGHDRSMKRHAQFRTEQKIIHGYEVEKKELKSEAVSHDKANCKRSSAS
ncbi:MULTISPECIES: hypothetical protein [Pseudomonas]|uniref:Secreted protein n=1 Tax=Pseudomonas donghuensis TaxID=1163398 RepID=A0AAQ0DPA9_9PSED|nr:MULTISPECIES: hypothetical protein [Pseudomonas]MBF4211188.1 hypothetical protein [Pseudomonas donghuensis]MCP6697690.1 hypothetical protein [Pseudomonas donghuensis]MDF9893494.1 hypothetical protein [Pseudomonas vranovensis]QWE81290.1 hypothetical protein BV82_13540 [Pseudomonas donghuensis]